jgi:hypothetical protein
MKQNNKFSQLLKVLQFDINDINLFYNDSLRDPYTDCGIEYNKPYPLNDETLNLEHKIQELKKLREDKLYCRIFNFTQTYYSIYQYLREKYSKNLDLQRNKIIEDFFSNEKKRGINRIEICNELKHNPKKDLEYKTHLSKEEIVSNSTRQIIYTNRGQTWFYEHIDSVALCNDLYNELLIFLEKPYLN